MATKKKMLQAAAGAAGGGGPTVIEDVFSTYLYTGTGSARTITNGIDLAGEGGLVWAKGRSGATDHQLFDTLRGATKELISNSSAAEATDADTLTAFNADGFSLGADANVNTNAATYASWTFRKAPRFFDVVTYTGNGVAGRQIAHDLGCEPGMIIIKKTNTSSNWMIYHKDAGNGFALEFNTDAKIARDWWNYTTPTSTHFTVTGPASPVNAPGDTYVAYLFAHDTEEDGIIQCGGYVGNGTGSDGLLVDIGWEPQYVIIKRTDDVGDWHVLDTIRGFNMTSDDKSLRPNLASAEESGTGRASPSATGFYPDANMNISGRNYIYIAIRRGPMRAPESGTEVFSPLVANNSGGTVNNTGFPIDLQLFRDGLTTTKSIYSVDRLRGVGTTNVDFSTPYLQTASTSAEVSSSFTRGWDNTGFQTATPISGASNPYWNFRRAPEFFDVVAYTWSGAPTTYTHNLGAQPEMIIQKARSSTSNWYVYHSALGLSDRVQLNTTDARIVGGSFITAVSDTTFSTSLPLGGGTTFITYLFATLAGISKVGSYTGNGTSQTINCGFTTGARFIIIKRTDLSGDWYVWDTARGIVAGDDPHLSLNTTAAEVTTDDSIDPDSSGFIVNQVAATNINVSAASYIFYAVA